MRNLVRVGTAVALAAVFAGSAFAQGDTEESLFDWFDGLGYPDVGKMPLVRVATGEWSMVAGGPKVNRYRNCFLLEDDGGTFRVLTPDLGQLTYTRTPDGTPEHERVGFEEADLKMVVSRRLQALREHVRREDDHPFRRWGARISERAELFVLARACRGQMLHQFSDELLGFSIKPPKRKALAGMQELQAALSDDLAHAEVWRTFVMFGDPDVSRRELLERLQAITKNFPGNRHTGRLRDTAAILEPMVKEDVTRAAKRRAPLEDLPQEELIAELIFQLRDQNGAQWSQPGACDIFNDQRGEKSPAHQLLNIGYDAVPQLIEVIDDRTFTRSVGYHRNFYFSHHVLRVGDCASAILSRIAGKYFYTRNYTNAAMVKDGESAKVRADVQEWWRGVQEIGVKQTLINGTEAGDRNSLPQAAKLRERFPEVALASIIRGARNAKEPWPRSQLVMQAAEIEGDAPVAFLCEEMSNAPTLYTRICAATKLQLRADPAAAPAMIAEWKKHGRRATDPDDWADNPEPLIPFLAGCGKPEAIAAITRDFQALGVERRVEIIDKLRPHHVFGYVPPPPGEKREIAPGVRAAVGDLMLLALLDTEVRDGYSGTWGDRSFHDPRVCDMAALVMVERRPDEFTFDIEAERRERDRQRFAIVNDLRTRRDLPPLGIPQARKVGRIGAQKTAPALEAIVRAADAEARSEALAEYEALGLGALPALTEHLAKSSPEDGLESLAKRLANTVAEIEVSKDGAEPDAALSKQLESLNGKPITAKGFVKLLLSTAAALPPGAAGVRFKMVRHGDGAGFEMAVELPTERIYQAGIQKGWRADSGIFVGNRSLPGSGGIFSRDYGLTEKAHEKLLKGLTEALDSAPDRPVRIRAGMVLEK